MITFLALVDVDVHGDEAAVGRFGFLTKSGINSSSSTRAMRRNRAIGKCRLWRCRFSLFVGLSLEAHNSLLPPQLQAGLPAGRVGRGLVAECSICYFRTGR